MTRGDDEGSGLGPKIFYFLTPAALLLLLLPFSDTTRDLTIREQNSVSQCRFLSVTKELTIVNLVEATVIRWGRMDVWPRSIENNFSCAGYLKIMGHSCEPITH